MGVYLNPGNDMFQMAINSEIYVDKTALAIHLMNLPLFCAIGMPGLSEQVE